MGFAVAGFTPITIGWPCVGRTLGGEADAFQICGDVIAAARAGILVGRIGRYDWMRSSANRRTRPCIKIGIDPVSAPHQAGS